MQFAAICRFFLGLPIPLLPASCLFCSAPLDPQGSHSTFCKVNNGEIIKRHNAVRNAIWSFCAEAGLTAILEKKGILGDVGGKRRPADVLVKGFSSLDMCLDVAVTSPLQSKFVSKAAESDGHSASAYFNLKKLKYAADVEESGSMSFLPLVVETFGRWHPDSLRFLDSLAFKHSINQDDGPTALKMSRTKLFQSLSFALQFHNSVMITERLSR
jgi:hypothetical protein